MNEKKNKTMKEDATSKPKKKNPHVGSMLELAQKKLEKIKASGTYSEGGFKIPRKKKAHTKKAVSRYV